MRAEQGGNFGGEAFGVLRVIGAEDLSGRLVAEAIGVDKRAAHTAHGRETGVTEGYACADV